MSSATDLLEGNLKAQKNRLKVLHGVLTILSPQFASIFSCTHFRQDKFPKDIAAMEQSLKRLEEQEQKYSAELDAALTEYTGLREQAQGFDPVQLYEARQAIRPGKEQEAENRAQQAYGEKYNSLLMFDSKKAVSRMLHEDIERQAVRRMVRQAQKEQQAHYKRKHKEQER